MVDSSSTPEEIVRKRPEASRPGRKRVRWTFAASRLKSESSQPSLVSPAEQFRISIKTEVALWRAFLGDEIDAILRDED
jgi:hypothetical protein